MSADNKQTTLRGTLILTAFIEQEWEMIKYWLPALAAGLLAWLAFLVVGDTPLIRASGLALAVVGVTLAMRWMGAVLALIGGLALAFSPAFWSQTGGAQSLLPATTILATIFAGIASIAIIRITKRPYITLGAGLFIFAIIFWSQISTPHSLRLTGLLTTWLLVILVHSLQSSNPRPEGPPRKQITPQQYMGILIILFVGVINDPLFVLLVPATATGLWLSNTPLRGWYWAGLLIITILGVRGITVTYVDSAWWSTSSIEAHNTGFQVKTIIADGWHEGIRWIDLIKLIIQQTTIVGAVLSILGLIRMTRWYPVLGIVLIIAFGFYSIFGLTYFGSNRQILLIPLFIIQTIWLTYAIYTFGQWLEKADTPNIYQARWLTMGGYALLPIYFIIQNT
jgi:hypothetical protein